MRESSMRESSMRESSMRVFYESVLFRESSMRSLLTSLEVYFLIFICPYIKILHFQLKNRAIPSEYLETPIYLCFINFKRI